MSKNKNPLSVLTKDFLNSKKMENEFYGVFALQFAILLYNKIKDIV